MATRQIFGHPHRRTLRHVVRGCHQHSMGRRQLARHHPLGQFEATTDGGIEALADQVDLAVIEMPVRADVGEATHERAQQRHHVAIAKHRTHAHFQGAHRPPFGAGQVGHGVLDGGEAAADLFKKQLAGFGEGKAPGAALEQTYAQARLKLGDTFAHCRRCQAQVPRRFGEAATLSAAHKTFDTAKAFHIDHSKLLVYTDYSNPGLPGGAGEVDTRFQQQGIPP